MTEKRTVKVVSGFLLTSALVLAAPTGGDARVRSQVLFSRPGQVVTGAGLGGGAHVRAFDATGTPVSPSFIAEAGSSGQRVAVGDLDGDGADEIVTASGPGVPGAVRVFGLTNDGVTFAQRSVYFPYGTAWKGGVSIAVGDVNGDGQGDIITGAGAGGGPHVRAFKPDGTALASFFAYDAAFHGGVEVAAGDVNGDGQDEIITGAGPGGGPHVRALTAAGVGLASFFAYAPGFTGGVFVGAGNIDADSSDEIVTGPGAGAGSNVRTFEGDGTLKTSFSAYEPAFFGGARVAAADLNGDGVAEVITGAGPGGGPHVRVATAAGGRIADFFAYNPRFGGGVYVGGGILTRPIINTDSR